MMMGMNTRNQVRNGSEDKNEHQIQDGRNRMRWDCKVYMKVMYNVVEKGINDRNDHVNQDTSDRGIGQIGGGVEWEWKCKGTSMGKQMMIEMAIM